jgi:hypothetical protein
MAQQPRPGTASADPALLTAYSDACTHAAQDLQNWFRGVLAPALSVYLNAAAARNEGANIDMSAVRRLANVVQDRLPRHIATIYYTDRDVRRVGRLFEEAGSSGGLHLPGILPLPGRPLDQVVHTTNDTLDRLDMRNGAALASQLDEAQRLGGSVLTTFMNELGQYADDPLFCAGFYNALSREQLEKLPWNATTAQALATAFASGKLSGDAQSSIAYVLMDRDNSGEVPTAVFAALAANPHGAANFTRYLLAHEGTFKLFLRGNGWSDWYPGFHGRRQQTAFLQGMLRVLASGETVMSPNEVRKLVATTAKDLPGGMDLKVAQGIENDLRKFLVTSANRLLGPPPARVPGTSYLVSLNGWAEDYGTVMRSLLPYVDWLHGIYEDNQAALAEEHAWIENIALGAVGGVLTGGIDEPVLAFAANGLYGGAAGQIQSLIPWGSGPGKPSADLDPNNYLHKAAALALVVAVYKHGLGRSSLQEALRQQGLQQLLSSLEEGHGPGGPGRQWATGQRLRLGDDARLELLIDALESHFK